MPNNSGKLLVEIYDWEIEKNAERAAKKFAADFTILEKRKNMPR
jgi:hypothetical protein